MPVDNRCYYEKLSTVKPLFRKSTSLFPLNVAMAMLCGECLVDSQNNGSSFVQKIS